MRVEHLFSLGLSLACAPALVGLAIAEDGSYAGAYTGQFTKQAARPIGSKDNLLIVEVAQGMNKSTGKDKFMDGGRSFGARRSTSTRAVVRSAV
ncbi:hypothetical protein [Methylobacterium durans]|uniref:hypothetical protein n=1 Tax=Methylobacterium durans TaxID=2202825 RepID=UPI0013A5B2A2|nr:hypothetical protein [Methylobacterium durans]